MPFSNWEHNMPKLDPKQPEFVLITSNYEKKPVMEHSLVHFYQFTTESDILQVIPDACVDVLFWKKDGKINTKIAGSFFKKGQSNAELGSEYFGVRFMPGVNPANGVAKLSELMNHEESFEEMITSNEEKERLLEGIYFSNSFEDKISIFMNYYKNCYDMHMEDKSSLKYILRNEIMHANGDFKLTDLSTLTGYSERYLNKKINEEFGMSPKNLIKIIRFQKTISNLTKTIDDINCTDTALGFGYYDQSHFNKEFKKFTGLTPTHYAENLLSNSYVKKLHILY